MESVLEMLAEKGVFIIESHYVLPVIQMNQFDTIYHEHLRHYSIHSLKYLLEAHGFEIIHTKPIPSHAGSIRIYAARKGDYPVKDTVAQMMETEKNTILKDGTLAEFRKKPLSPNWN